jgi:asparagine synthase (glutamine-hydrolysing)
VYQQDEPFGGIPTLAYLHNAFAVKQAGITVVLEGQGGDELFAGYDKYYVPHLRDLQARQSPEFARALATYSSRTKKSKEQVLALLADPEQRIVHIDDTKAVCPEVLNPTWSAQYASRRVPLESPFHSHLLNAQYHDLRALKLPRVLRFNDHMTMAAALELRVPYLDYRLVELAFALPAHLKIHNEHAKWAERELTAGRLPDSIRLRPKSSVVTPQTPWLQGDRTLMRSLCGSDSRPSAQIPSQRTAFLSGSG